MKKRYGSLTLAGLLWALASTGIVQGDLVQSDLDRAKTELEISGPMCHMGFELEPNG